MDHFKYDCSQPIFYLGASTMSLAFLTVVLYKLYQIGAITMLHMLLYLTLSAVVIYLVSRLVNWCCKNGHVKTAWVLATLPIISTLLPNLL